MKLLTTAIFLIVSLVMMRSSFAQDYSLNVLAAVNSQTAVIQDQITVTQWQTEAIERQTAAIIELTRVIEAIAVYNNTEIGQSYHEPYVKILEAFEYITYIHEHARSEARGE